jgi:queuine/archaeosine tRNA-ribosyltransferase
MYMKTSITDTISSLYQSGKNIAQKASTAALLGYITIDNALAGQLSTQASQAQTAAQQPQEAGFGGFLVGGLLLGGSIYAKKNMVPKIVDAQDKQVATYATYAGMGIGGLIVLGNLLGC